jgi:hypothetical protein
MYYGPQAGLETAVNPLGGTQIHRGAQVTTVFGHERTAFGASVTRRAADAFYSLGTFMVLVQVRTSIACPSLATASLVHLQWTLSALRLSAPPCVNP